MTEIDKLLRGQSKASRARISAEADKIAAESGFAPVLGDFQSAVLNLGLAPYCAPASGSADVADADESAEI